MTIERPIPPRAESQDSISCQSATRHRPDETRASESRKPAEGLSRRLMLAGLAALPVAVPTPAATAEPDPIFAAIERHRAAVTARSEAVEVQFRFEGETCCVRDMNAAQTRHYKTLESATRAAWDHLDDVSADLVNTPPATLDGIIALCRYLEPILDDPDAVDLPESVSWDDGTESTTQAAFANAIATAAKALSRGQA